MVYENEKYYGERLMYVAKDITTRNCSFDDGESPFKECSNVTVENCTFGCKYPFWYTNGINMSYGTLEQTARAGLWYCDNIDIKYANIEAPKNLRRCNHVKLTDVKFPNGQETLWDCHDVELLYVESEGDYFAMNSSDLHIERMNLKSKYSFDGVKNETIINSSIIGRDAFWNCENITVYDSYIEGEYIAWNSKNITFVNCTIKSLQGLCYSDNIVLKNCKLEGTSLAFEYSTVDATITDKVDSILNPKSGVIKAKGIGLLILEKDKSDFKDLTIDCNEIDKTVTEDAVKYF